MSTSVIEPGTRLAGRYRLDERFSESAGSTLWKATDEILARAVAVRTFLPEFPRIREVVTAARSASRLTDPRLTQVFDADDSGELAYVVSEWVTGQTLEEMVVGNGPMEPGRAATLLFEAAQALAAAHAAGLWHLRLTSRDLLWTTGNTVKILGLGVDAALAGVVVEDPAQTDVRGLARLLYAALTAHWPGTGDDADPRGKLPAAPESNGVICRPGQVVPSVPLPLDTLTCRALGLLDTEPVTGPRALAEGLSRMPRSPLPMFAGLTQGPPPSVPQPPVRPSVPAPARHAAPRNRTFAPAASPTTSWRGTQVLPSPPGGSTHRSTAGSDQPKDRRAVLAVAAGVAAVVIGLVGWQVLQQGGGGQSHKNVRTGSVSGSSTPDQGVVQLTPAGASGFDANPQDHPDTAVGNAAQSALVGHGPARWHSQTYKDARFGMLKSGIGLLIDMGSPVTLNRVHVNVPSASGPGTLELRIGDAPSSLDSLKQVGVADSAAGPVDIAASQGARGRYILLWFTKLPGVGGGFRAQLAGVSVYGRQG